MNKLPNGWVECKLGDVLYLQNGYAFKSNEYKKAGIPLIRISDIQNGIIDTTNCVRIDNENLDKAFVVKNGDFLIAMSGATTGKTGVYREKQISYLNQRVGNLKIYDENVLLPKYRNYFISSKRQEIEKLAYGGAQPNISKQIIENLKLLLPPLDEQKRIVEKIEREFKLIDEGIKSLKKAQEQIKQYRHCVLNSAFNGKLTKQDISSWTESKLGDVFKTASGGTPSKSKSEYYGGNIPWLKSGELNDGFIYESEEYITDEGLKNSSAKIFPKGSLLVALYGATVGKLGILNFDSTTNQAICCIYQNDNHSITFLFYYLLLKRQYLINLGKGGAQPNISQEIIKNLKIPLPPLAEQQKIVKEIEKRFSAINSVEVAVNESLLKAKQLKQSILKIAFEGRLVAQDLDNEPTT